MSEKDDEQLDLHTLPISRSGTKRVVVQPVMEVTISKTKRDETKTQEEVKCVLYDARSNPKHDIDAEMKLKKGCKANKSTDGFGLYGKR